MSEWKLTDSIHLGNDLYTAQNLIDYSRDFVINPDEIYGLIDDREDLKRLKSRIAYIEHKLGNGWVEGLYNTLSKGNSDE